MENKTMTVEKALDVFSKAQICHLQPIDECLDKDCTECPYNHTEEENEGALEAAKVALEKQIPKKPEIEKGFYGDVCKCPSCGEYMGYRAFHMTDTYNFCPNCGQAIVWTPDNTDKAETCVLCGETIPERQVFPNCSERIEGGGRK